MDSFDFNELLFKYRLPLIILFLGFILTVSGVFIVKSGILEPPVKVEIIGATPAGQGMSEVTVEIAGAVQKPGVYKLAGGARTEDLVVAAGGFSGDADRVWTDKYLNRASKLTDGQKLFIPSINQQTNVMSAKSDGGYQSISSTFSSDSNRLININSATLGELDTLPGIGQVYGQNIIEHRPYSNVSELLSKGVLKKNVYEKIKDLVSVN